MHLATYTASAAGKMISHYERSIGERDHIDRDGVVYNLAPKFDRGPRGRYRELTKDLEIGPKTRPLADMIVTKPKSYSGDVHEFFKAAYDELVEMVGGDRVVCAYVHLDEPGAEPHMHFAFVPVVEIEVMTNDKTQPLLWTESDEKKNPEHKAGTQKRDNKGTLRWKRVPARDEAGNPIMYRTAKASAMFSKADMRDLHPKMEENLCRALQVDHVGIVLDENDPKKKLSGLEHDEYERVTAEIERSKRELAETRAEIADETERLESVRRSIATSQGEVDRVEVDIRVEEDAIRGLESQISVVEDGNRRARSRVEELRSRIAEARSALTAKLQGLVARARSVAPALYAASSRALAASLAPVETSRVRVPALDEFVYDRSSGAYHATIGAGSFEIRPTGDGAYTWLSNVAGEKKRKIVIGDAYAAWRDLNEAHDGEKPSTAVPMKSKAAGARSVNKDRQQVSQPRISHQTTRPNRGFSR